MHRISMKSGYVTHEHLGNLAPLRDREESASRHNHVLILKHYASARKSDERNGHLMCGDVILVWNSMISENRPRPFQMLQMYSKTSQMPPPMSLDAPTIVLYWYHVVQKTSFSSRWNPRTRCSLQRFQDLDGPNRIHGLPTYCSSLPKLHFDARTHFTMW